MTTQLRGRRFQPVESQQVGDQFRAYLVHSCRACWGYLLSGDRTRAEGELRLALSLGERLGTRFFLGAYLSTLGWLPLAAGDAADALRHSREAAQVAAQSGSSWEQSMALRKWELAQSVLESGHIFRQPQIADARRACERALGLFEEMGVSWGVAASREALGR